MQAAATTVRDPRQLQALADPARVAILDALREPGSAASVARELGRSRQGVNYHVKALLKAGLLQEAGTRQTGNFIEQLYQAAARRFIVPPDLATTPERLAAAFAEQTSLRYLAELGARLNADALALAETASAAGAEVPTATVESEVRFADEAARSAFLDEYVKALEGLLQKHGSKEGAPFRTALVIYPDPED
jgi:DNA-binding transcriptional ArsR family regulator